MATVEVNFETLKIFMAIEIVDFIIDQDYHIGIIIDYYSKQNVTNCYFDCYSHSIHILILAVTHHSQNFIDSLYNYFRNWAFFQILVLNSQELVIQSFVVFVLATSTLVFQQVKEPYNLVARQLTSLSFSFLLPILFIFLFRVILRIFILTPNRTVFAFLFAPFLFFVFLLFTVTKFKHMITFKELYF
jgi:hypothetical protein